MAICVVERLVRIGDPGMGALISVLLKRLSSKLVYRFNYDPKWIKVIRGLLRTECGVIKSPPKP